MALHHDNQTIDLPTADLTSGSGCPAAKPDTFQVVVAKKSCAGGASALPPPPFYLMTAIALILARLSRASAKSGFRRSASSRWAIASCRREGSPASVMARL